MFGSVFRYLLGRLVTLIQVAVVVSLIAFIMLRLTPGDPVLMYAGEERDAESLAQIRQSLGLDQPWPVQYLAWLSRALTGDLGRSIRTQQPVTSMIVDRLPATLELGVSSLCISVVLGVGLGAVTALKRGTLVDALASMAAVALVCLPGFLIGLTLLLTLSLSLRVLPPGGYTPLLADPLENLRRLAMPALTLAATSLAVNFRHARSSILDSLSRDYIRTAKAKGLGEAQIVRRHALKNAAIPLVTLVGLQAAAIIDGAVIAELVFSWPGVGRLVAESIAARDYPVIQAIVLFSTFAYMGSSLLVDLSYSWLDPRIRVAR